SWGRSVASALWTTPPSIRWRCDGAGGTREEPERGPASGAASVPPRGHVRRLAVAAPLARATGSRGASGPRRVVARAASARASASGGGAFRVLGEWSERRVRAGAPSATRGGALLVEEAQAEAWLRAATATDHHGPRLGAPRLSDLLPGVVPAPARADRLPRHLRLRRGSARAPAPARRSVPARRSLRRGPDAAEHAHALSGPGLGPGHRGPDGAGGAGVLRLDLPFRYPAPLLRLDLPEPLPEGRQARARQPDPRLAAGEILRHDGRLRSSPRGERHRRDVRSDLRRGALHRPRADPGAAVRRHPCGRRRGGDERARPARGERPGPRLDGWARLDARTSLLPPDLAHRLRVARGALHEPHRPAVLVPGAVPLGRLPGPHVPLLPVRDGEGPLQVHRLQPVPRPLSGGGQPSGRREAPTSRVPHVV